MVWGPGYGGAAYGNAPSGPPVGQDPFDAAERGTRALVAAGWWQSAPPQQRQHAIGGHMLVLPDGTWWLFGAWARWYRLHPSDGQWYLCPPPRSPGDRMAARPAQQSSLRTPGLPPHVVPAGPDFEYDPPGSLPFVRSGFAPDLTSRVRATVESAAALPVAEYPHWWSQFTPETPSTVAVSWGVMLWCANAPAFDSRMDAQMLDLWKPYRAKPLPATDGPRWLTPPPLETLVGLYAERLRASRVDAAVVVLRTMWAVASALREDVRFQMRADALLAILGTTLSNPTVDYGALPYGDQAIVQQWLTRCPPNLVPALRNESSPGDNFRHAFYSLAERVASHAGDASNPAFIEPRLVAAALLAADLAVVRGDMAASIVPWLDPEIRYTVQAVLDRAGHPLRRMWPDDLRLAEPLRSAPGIASGDGAETLLAAMYELDLAWCRLAGVPARPRGFPVPTALIAGLMGRARVRATAKAPTVTTPPAAPAFGQQTPPFSAQSQPGFAPGPSAQSPQGPAEPNRPYVQPPAQPGAGMAEMQQPAAFTPHEEEKQEGPVAPPYTELGFQRPGAPAPMHQPPPPPAQQHQPAQPPQQHGQGQNAPAAFGMPGAPAQPPYAAPEPQAAGFSPEEEKQEGPVAPPYTELGYQRAGGPPGPGVPPAPAQPAQPQAPPIDPHGTRMDGAAAAAMQPPVPPTPPGSPPSTRILGPDAADEAGVHQMPPANPPGDAPGTRFMSETMIGDFDFLDDTPSPERPVHLIPPPQDRSERRVLERYGIGFVSGQLDSGELLDELRAQAEAWTAASGAALDSTRVDGADGPRGGVPSVLLVGNPHTGQRRMARLIALTMADTGIGDGSIRAHDADDVRDAPAERMQQVLAQQGPAILFERLDVAVTSALDPAAVASAVRRARGATATTVLIATCDPRSYKRLLQDHPKLVQTFRVHRLPDLSDLDNRMTLLHLLADERRVTLGAPALEAAREDLGRLRGPGDLVNARLVEAYLDQASQRALDRAGASRDRLVLVPDDLGGVAEGIEPALRPPGDIDGYLRQLDRLTGLAEVKRAVRELAEDAELAAGRARHGVPDKDPRHLIFTGPSGTGKTTVAGLLGGVYAALGLLQSGHVVACRPVHLAGRDRTDTEARVAGMVDQALGGVLLIQEAYLLDRTPAVVQELQRSVRQRGDRFMVVLSSPAAEAEGFLAGNPVLRGEFGRILEFEGMGDRDLVKLFQSYAERDLYMLDEELRLELLARFERLRADPAFAYARTVRLLFEQTVARQAARLAGADVNAATVARLSARDLPESSLEQMLGDFQQGL